MQAAALYRVSRKAESCKNHAFSNAVVLVLLIKKITFWIIQNWNSCFNPKLREYNPSRQAEVEC